MPRRRSVLDLLTRGAGTPLALAAAASCAVAVAQGQAPMAKTQPGFYRMMLGDFEITALNDCVVPYGVSTLPGATPEQIKSGLAEMHLTAPVGMSYNAFLVNTGHKLLLIDTGTGGAFADDPGFHGCGRLLANLRASGYEPSQVDEVYITHVGPDHVGGLTHEGRRTFPNALVRAAHAEVDIYIDAAKTAAVLDTASKPADEKAWFDFQRGLFEPYIKAGKFQRFEGDVALAPGVRALATPGHSPGHTSYVVESRGQTLVVMGDLVHWGAIQFPFPTAYTSFDTDHDAATAQRLRVFRMVAENNYWAAGAHLSFPGIGHISAGDGRFYWIPANYTIPGSP